LSASAVEVPTAATAAVPTPETPAWEEPAPWPVPVTGIAGGLGSGAVRAAVAVRAPVAGRAGESFTRVSGAAAAALAGVTGGAGWSGRIAAKSASARLQLWGHDFERTAHVC